MTPPTPADQATAPLTLATLDARVRAVVDAVTALSDEAARPAAFAVIAGADPDCRWELDIRLGWAVEHLTAIREASQAINLALGKIGTDGSRGPYPTEYTDAAIAAAAQPSTADMTPERDAASPPGVS